MQIPEILYNQLFSLSKIFSYICNPNKNEEYYERRNSPRKLQISCFQRHVE